MTEMHRVLKMDLKSPIKVRNKQKIYKFGINVNVITSLV